MSQNFLVLGDNAAAKDVDRSARHYGFYGAEGVDDCHILGDSPYGVLTWEDSTISITGDATALNSIIKLTDNNGKIKYIGIERY